MKFKIGIVLIFLGSVFLTSEKFVNTENTVKFYITVFGLFIGIITLLLRSVNIKIAVQEIASLSMMKGLYVVGVFQALYGVLQYIGKYQSNHSSFAVTGSFDNPAGFIAVLSLLFPIGVFWSLKSKNIEQRIVFFSLGLVFFSIIISGSRTGLLAILISTISIFTSEFELISKILYSRKNKLLVLLSIVILLLGIFALYKWKPDSADGRLLIWNVSTEMIKDNPLIGFGRKGFQTNYMAYQANYFEQNSGSKFVQLADNVTHPFNEFIKLTVNQGVIGLMLCVLLISLLFGKIFKLSYSNKNILLGVFVSFITLSFFSYPLQYAPIWLLLSYFILVLFAEKLPNKKILLMVKISIIGFCLGGIIFFSFRMYYEMEWKETAVKSLQGKTNQMLPKYEKLYPHLKNNSLYLYNYGAELNALKKYTKSIAILNKCQKGYNDYDLQMLLADNFYHIGDTTKAIKTYEYAKNMIPCRFLPLYRQFEIYKENENTIRAIEIAKEIVDKQVKIKSSTVNSIIIHAENYLNENAKE